MPGGGSGHVAVTDTDVTVVHTPAAPAGAVVLPLLAPSVTIAFDTSAVAMVTSATAHLIMASIVCAVVMCVVLSASTVRLCTCGPTLTMLH
jgi:hypothetical protein